MKFFICNISNKLSSEQEISLKQKLEESFGNFVEIQKEDAWDAPIEYINEMGDTLKTKIYFFTTEKTEEKIDAIKSFCIKFEKETSIQGNRVFNLNPGFLSNEGMFLVSHKPSEKRGRIDFRNYWIEKQYDINEEGKYTINSNTFSEYKIYLEDLEKVI